MSIGPLSPLYSVSATPIAQAGGAQAERAAQAAEAHVRLVAGQQRSAAAAQVDQSSAENNVTDDRESERMAWQAPASSEGEKDADPSIKSPDSLSATDGPLGHRLDLSA
ncbi:MAG TPA: hypothetical protein VGN12_21300 [Pirellulales bacterium]|jgi:hypothetical protein